MGLPVLLDAVAQLAAFVQLVDGLPRIGETRRVGPLAGSSDAAVVAALARRLEGRFFVVVTDGVAEAERWLADLGALLDDAPIALYPPREAFGEVEPHMEVAGERVETIEALGRGAVRILLTTARAVLERTRLPAAVRASRLEIRPGEVRRPETLAKHLEGMGYERVALVDDVAQFSIRGGIVDIYGFGMAEPVRLEYWGDEIANLRHFDLRSQRSTRDAARVVLLPLDGHAGPDVGDDERGTLADLFPPDTICIHPAAAHLEQEMRRTWDEAEHHIEIARRRGEDVPAREALFQSPDAALAALSALPTIGIAPPM